RTASHMDNFVKIGRTGLRLKLWPNRIDDLLPVQLVFWFERKKLPTASPVGASTVSPAQHHPSQRLETRRVDESPVRREQSASCVLQVMMPLDRTVYGLRESFAVAQFSSQLTRLRLTFTHPFFQPLA